MPKYVASPMAGGLEIFGEYPNVQRMIAFGLRAATPGKYRVMSVDGTKRKPITITYVGR